MRIPETGQDLDLLNQRSSSSKASVVQESNEQSQTEFKKIYREESPELEDQDEHVQGRNHQQEMSIYAKSEKYSHIASKSPGGPTDEKDYS